MRSPGSVRPPRLRPGMTIGVVAPSSGIRDARLEEGIRQMNAAGYQVALGDHLYDRFGYLAGLDAARGADLTEMFQRQDVQAVFCGRGGYGAARMLDYVDWDVVRANPKVFVGYSDITSLHLAMERECGLVTFHGPMICSHGGGLSETSASTFWRLLQEPEPLGTFDTRDGTVRTLVPGTAEGKLAGGCLCLLASAVGAREQPDFTGRIVLIEDVGEAVYRLDRYLTQLLRAGILQSAAGFVIGTATDWHKHEKEDAAITPDDLWRTLVAPLGKPAVTGFPFGHEPNPLTLPLGCRVTLDATARTLTFTEPAVI